MTASWRRTLSTLVVLPLLAACAVGDSDDEFSAADTTTAGMTAPSASALASGEQQQFWNALTEICGNAYAGTVIEAPAGDTTFAGKDLVMHVRSCTDSEIRIPFHVGQDRSRTWVITRTGSGLRLKHDHRHEDGTEDVQTQYGGDTADPGTAQRQEFPADAFTSELIPEASTNFWTVEVVPGQQYVYALRREGTDRRFRIEFDLTQTVATPPAPWGTQD